MVKQIPLGGKKGAGMFALVDDDMYELLSKYSWSLSGYGYADGGRRAQSDLGHRSMHRVVNRTPADLFTDHLDHNKLNNQRSNLRSVTPAQNVFNSSKWRNKKGKYKGVYETRTGRWVCIVNLDGKSVNFGTFKTQRDAAIAYNQVAVKHFGEYACLNDIPENDEDDLPTMKRHLKRRSQSSYVGVTPQNGAYNVNATLNGRTKFIGSFPNEIFAARIYDAVAVMEYGSEAIRHVNFTELINFPLSLDSRYIFKAKPKGQFGYVGISKQERNVSWFTLLVIDDKRVRHPFPTAILAAEHYDKLVLIHRDNICTLINFPEKLPQYLAEIGDKIISPKPIVIPDLT